MRRIVSWPILRLSLALASLSISLVLVCYSFRLIPDNTQKVLNLRSGIAESLAIQLATLLNRRDISAIDDTMTSVVARNAEIISIGVRGSDGSLIASSAGHHENWHDPANGKSNPQQVMVPLLEEGVPKGAIEIAFRPSPELPDGVWGITSEMLKLIALIGSASLVGFYFVLKRSLSLRTSSKAVPHRVGAAFDTLAEGVVIVDDTQSIQLVNEAFSQGIAASAHSLVGCDIDRLPWVKSPESSASDVWPWKRAYSSAAPVLNIPMSIRTELGEIRNLTVNATPIIDDNGFVRGVINTFDDVTLLHKTNDELQQSMDRLRQSQVTITEQNRQLHEVASSDPLTGCLNRRAFFAGAEKLFADARELSKPAAFLMFDADHFKSINDRFGHAVGDKVLIGLVQVLRGFCTDRDLLGRYGGEEFCMAIAFHDEEYIETVADRIRRAVAAVSTWLPNEERVTVSIGVAFSGDASCEIPDLTKRSDEALYHAKRTGRNRAVNWTRMSLEGNTEAEAISGIRRIIQQRAFECAFQPKVDVREKRVLGFEALARCEQQSNCSEFIRLAIAADMVGELTNCVLDFAISALDSLDPEFGSETTMSINVAARLVNDSGFMFQFVHRIQQSGFAGRIILELTEESFIEQGAFQEEIAPLLQQFGIRVSIDDFGTGYSSLSALAGITATELKIDRSFVTEIYKRSRQQKILQTISSLGSSLGMTVVAEGVETFEELAYLLAATNIRIVQGFYFCPPFLQRDAHAVARRFREPDQKAINANVPSVLRA